MCSSMYPLDCDMEMACSDATWNGTRVHYCSVGGMEPGPTACVGGMEPGPTACVGGMEPVPTACVG